MEVFQLASRHHSLDLSELADVTDLMHAFEAQNSVKLELRCGTSIHGKTPTLGLVLLANSLPTIEQAASVLASVSVTCSATGLKSWNAVLTHALYALDFQLAQHEFDNVAVKKA